MYLKAQLDNSLFWRNYILVIIIFVRSYTSDESESDGEDVNDDEDGDSNVKEKVELEKFEKLVREGKSGSLSAAEIEKYAGDEKKDRTFQRFVRVTKRAPKQVVRYSRGGKPLWVSDNEVPESVPNCDFCGGPRIFEFQLMPQLLASLGLDSGLDQASIDWGVLVVYSCRDSCDATGGPAYKKEFLFRQNVQQ